MIIEGIAVAETEKGSDLQAPMHQLPRLSRELVTQSISPSLVVGGTFRLIRDRKGCCE